MNVREIEVLNIVCGSDRPLTCADIVNKKKGLSQSTVITVLRKLVANKLVVVDGVTHSGKVLSRTYIQGPNAKGYIEEHYLKEFTMTKNIMPLDDLVKIVNRLKEEAHG